MTSAGSLAGIQKLYLGSAGIDSITFGGAEGYQLEENVIGAMVDGDFTVVDQFVITTHINCLIDILYIDGSNYLNLKSHPESFTR